MRSCSQASISSAINRTACRSVSPMRMGFGNLPTRARRMMLSGWRRTKAATCFLVIRVRTAILHVVRQSGNRIAHNPILPRGVLSCLADMIAPKVILESIGSPAPCGVTAHRIEPSPRGANHPNGTRRRKCRDTRGPPGARTHSVLTGGWPSAPDHRNVRLISAAKISAVAVGRKTVTPRHESNAATHLSALRRSAMDYRRAVTQFGLAAVS
jgi:hypothetical protein